MRRTVLALLATVLSVPSCLGAEGYSFETYLSERGGCNGQRQILDKRLKEIRFDFVDPGKADTGRGIELFGQAAAEWTEQDIQGVIATFRRCEEHLFRVNLDPTGQPQNRKAMVKDYEVLIARGAARIEESLREIILVDRRNAARATGSGAGSLAAGVEKVSADRFNRDMVLRMKPEVDPAAPLGTAPPADAEGLRQAEARLTMLQDARRVAKDRERDTQRSETPRADQRIAPRASDIERTGEVLSYVPRAVANSQNCALTRDGFDQIQRGMPLERVEAVIGCRGTHTATSTAADLGKIEVQHWEDRRTSGSITVQFLNSLVYAKSQVGVN
jgi:hypothetical protein